MLPALPNVTCNRAFKSETWKCEAQPELGHPSFPSYFLVRSVNMGKSISRTPEGSDV